MNTSRTFTVIVTVAILAAVVGCTGPRTWPEDGPSNAAPANVRRVLIAPVDVGPVANVYPEAELAYARDMAARLDRLYENVQSWVGQTLPLSSDPRWSQGPVGAAAGARLVVLTEVLDVVVEEASAGMSERVAATVRMRGIDPNGDEIWRNELIARVGNETSPKRMHASARPPSRAAWTACKKLLDGLGEWVEKQPIGEKQWGDDDRDEAVLVDISIESSPSGADILVDGVFRGNTPAVVPLPVRSLTLKLERQGYQPWEQTFTPDSGMRINPGLEPLPGTGDDDTPDDDAPDAAP